MLSGEASPKHHGRGCYGRHEKAFLPEISCYLSGESQALCESNTLSFIYRFKISSNASFHRVHLKKEHSPFEETGRKYIVFAF